MSTATSLITVVDFVCIPTLTTTELSRHGETLGLERRKRWGDMPATEFRPATYAAVTAPTAFGQPKPRPNGVPIVLQVDDVETARTAPGEGRHLVGRAAGLGRLRPGLRSDPDGNPLTRTTATRPAATRPAPARRPGQEDAEILGVGGGLAAAHRDGVGHRRRVHQRPDVHRPG